MRNRLISTAALIVAVLLWLPIGGAKLARADQPSVVRVGVYPLTEYNRIENGQVSGYNADYLEQVARYTGWKFVYVILESWEACTAALEAGRVDITSPTLFTPERATRYLYSSYPHGTSYTALITLKSSPVSYEDAEGIGKLRVAITNNSLWLSDFTEFIRLRNFQLPRMIVYPDVQTARAAMHEGAVDAMLNGVVGLQPDEKVLAKCNPVPFYYIAMQKNAALMRELDRASAQLKMEQPDLEYRLARTYLPHVYDTPLSKAELDFIAHAPVLRVGYDPDRKPYSWKDPVSNKAKGILPDILRTVEQRSGLHFAFIPLTDRKRKISDYFNANELDLATDTFFSSTPHTNNNYRLSAPLARGAIYLYTEQNRKLVDDAPFILAVSSAWRCGAKYAAKAFPQAQLKPLPNAEDCLTAVVRGEADATLDSALSINYLTGKPRFSSIVPQQDSNGFEESRLAFREGLPDTLQIIVNNLLLSLDEKVRNQIISDNLAAATPPLTLADLVYEHRSMLLIIVELLLFISALTAYALHLRRKSIYRAQANEQRLAHIADNINGGVISIAPQLPLRLLDANNGFWQLLGYEPAKPGVWNFMELLHEDDVEKLLHSIAEITQRSPTLNMELRLRRRNGDWLPLLVRGTLSSDSDDNPAIDCVVMDITEQKHMQEELEQEKERYRIILEQSQDIIFDVDTEKRQFQCSPHFLLKFGREATPLFSAEGRPNNNHIIHPDDLPALIEMRRRVRAGNPTVFAVMRIPTAEGRYIWCRVQTTRISKTGAPLRLVGKIVDIDDEVRRRVELERRSQRDSLTDLLNKTAFRERVVSNLPSRPDQDKADALLFLDLDNFKLLNDTMGHIKGDEVLVEAAETLKHVFRSADGVGRFGGDEFCIFVKGITRAALRERAEALLAGLNMVFEQDGQRVELSASLGIYTFDGTETSYEAALQRADNAQYHAKQAGKNCYRFYDEVADIWSEVFAATEPTSGMPKSNGNTEQQ